MSFAALPPEGHEAALSLALWPLAPAPAPEPEPDWVTEISMALPPLPESLPPVAFSLPPGAGADPYGRLLASLSDSGAGSIWFT